MLRKRGGSCTKLMKTLRKNEKSTVLRLLEYLIIEEKILCLRWLQG